jgi:hypothetical protein
VGAAAGAAELAAPQFGREAEREIPGGVGYGWMAAWRWRYVSLVYHGNIDGGRHGGIGFAGLLHKVLPLFTRQVMNKNIEITTLLPPLALGVYRHYKGPLYEVLGLARHSETEEWLVVYRTLYGELGWWVRPAAMFMESVEVDGQSQPRFAYLDPASR